MTSMTVIATADIRPHEPIIIMNGLARPAYEGEPSRVASSEAIKRGEAFLYNPETRSIARKVTRRVHDVEP